MTSDNVQGNIIYKIMIETNTEQWKSEGYCTKCRRENYCRKRCTAYTRRINRELNQLAEELIAKKLFKGTK